MIWSGIFLMSWELGLGKSIFLKFCRTTDLPDVRMIQQQKTQVKILFILFIFLLFCFYLKDIFNNSRYETRNMNAGMLLHKYMTVCLGQNGLQDVCLAIHRSNNLCTFNSQINLKLKTICTNNKQSPKNVSKSFFTENLFMRSKIHWDLDLPTKSNW